jgi:hypothetical protein
MYERE